MRGAATRLLGLSVLLLNLGCVSSLLGSGPHARWPFYAIGFANRTSELLSDVRSEWVANGVKYAPSAGFLGTNSTKEDNEAPDPIPESATVIWKTPDGKEHRQTLIVAKKIKNISTWTGTVWFKFTEKGVEVVPLSKKEMDDLADARKDYP